MTMSRTMRSAGMMAAVAAMAALAGGTRGHGSRPAPLDLTPFLPRRKAAHVPHQGAKEKARRLRQLTRDKGAL